MLFKMPMKYHGAGFINEAYQITNRIGEDKVCRWQ